MCKNYEQTFFKKNGVKTVHVPVLEYSLGRVVDVYKPVTLNLLLISEKNSVYHLPSTFRTKIKCSGRLWSVAVAPQATGFQLGDLLVVTM